MVSENERHNRLRYGFPVLPLACFLFFVTAVLAITYFQQFITAPASKKPVSKLITISSGQSLKTIASNLQETGIVKNSFLFVLLARIKQAARSIKAGEYELNTGMNPKDVLHILVSGRERLIRVTIPEGLTMNDIARILEEKSISPSDTFLSLAHDPDHLSSLGITGTSVEGYLFPDTYRFRRDMESVKVQEIMVDRWKEIFNPYVQRCKELEMSIAEVMTLASIVEKETGGSDERPLVASVFLNRLKKGMKLAADPTVIYGIEDFNGNLTRTHLRTDTPYNTYTRTGLPPGPISNPGKQSIHAVLYPAESDFLFFVSRNDGTHIFSKTYTEHRRNVARYQKKSDVAGSLRSLIFRQD